MPFAKGTDFIVMAIACLSVNSVLGTCGSLLLFFSANSASYSASSALNMHRISFNVLFNAEITEADAESAKINQDLYDEVETRQSIGREVWGTE